MVEKGKKKKSGKLRLQTPFRSRRERKGRNVVGKGNGL